MARDGRRYSGGRPDFGNKDWYKQAYEKAPPPPASDEGKFILIQQQEMLLLEQQVRERDQMIAVLRDRIAELERQLRKGDSNG